MGEYGQPMVTTTALDVVRRLRRRTDSFLGPLWRIAGKALRAILQRSPWRPPVERRIGLHGPFKMDPHFAFLDLEGWSSGQNAGFERCIDLSRGASCVFDIGAHVGFVTLPLSRSIPDDGIVYSFEPARANLSLLRKHLSINDVNNVVTVDALLGGADGELVEFHEVQEPSGMNSIALKRSGFEYSSEQRTVLTLDTFCRANRLNPDLMKIDVEGSELSVLTGARNVLSKNKPTLMLSVHPGELNILGHTVGDVETLLRELGYAFFDVDMNPVDSLQKGENVVMVEVSR